MAVSAPAANRLRVHVDRHRHFFQGFPGHRVFLPESDHSCTLVHARAQCSRSDRSGIVRPVSDPTSQTVDTAENDQQGETKGGVESSAPVGVANVEPVTAPKSEPVAVTVFEKKPAPKTKPRGALSTILDYWLTE